MKTGWVQAGKDVCAKGTGGRGAQYVVWISGQSQIDGTVFWIAYVGQTKCKSRLKFLVGLAFSIYSVFRIEH